MSFFSGIGKAFNNVGGLLGNKGASGSRGSGIVAGGLFDHIPGMPGALRDFLKSGALDNLSMAQAFADGDYGSAIGFLSDIEKKKKREKEERGAGVVEHRREGFSPRGLGQGIY